MGIAWLVPGNRNEAAKILFALGYTVERPFEQHIVTPNATILKVSMGKGRVYLNASNKPKGTTLQHVSGFPPSLLSEPLYVNLEEWILLEDYGPTLPDDFADCEVERILILHGKLQLESTGHLQGLMNAAFPRASADRITQRAKGIFEDPGIR